MPILAGKAGKGIARAVHSPIDGSTIGSVHELPPAEAGAAMAAAAAGTRAFARTPVETRARCLERAADLLEAEAPAFIAMLAAEGGKTLDDAVAEIREAVDYCLYYAAEARRLSPPAPQCPVPPARTIA